MAVLIPYPACMPPRSEWGHDAATSAVASADLDESLDGDSSLPPALSGVRKTLESRRAGRVSWYEAGPAPSTENPPLLLIHGISAASSAHDMRPLYDRCGQTRRVIALDLPGFGASQRGARRYTPRLMTDAVHAMVDHIQRTHRTGTVDAIALSLSCEFVARAAVERSVAFRYLAFVNPTGFEGRDLHFDPPGSHRGREWLLSLLVRHGWGRPLHGLLTRRRAIRHFLSRAWGTKRLDERLVEYGLRTSQVAGAEYAPLHFLSGFLSSGDSGRLYRQLKQPVWATHGMRGAYSRSPGLACLADRPNWRIEAFQTGAMPHFEVPDYFVDRYHSYLRSPPRAMA